jgi:hypothetical protein
MIELNEITTHLYFFQKRIEYFLAEFHFKKLNEINEIELISLKKS